jgi:GTP diphosphokinase / guanosine-3',5'-bis(diphosphate) 3'-diphosphatase
MHEIAERGVAAHALYKETPDAKGMEDGFRLAASESNAYRWLRHLMEVLEEGDSPKEFLEHTRLELFQDQVFCFTPKGQLVALPNGATPIDFAYMVHTSIGDSCVGCKINGRHAPLVTQLKNGDEVEVIRSEASSPPSAWEAIAITGKAKAAIRRATRTALRKQFAGLGRDIVDVALDDHKHKASDKELGKAVRRLGHKNLDDALAAVGRGDLQSVDILRSLGVAVEDDEVRAEKRKAAQRRGPTSGDQSIPVRGVKSQAGLKLFLGTGAVPGERIVGILTPGQGVTIYPIFAKALAQFDAEPERWVDLTWSPADADQRFPARIKVVLVNEVGALAQVTQVIGDLGGNIDELEMHARHGVRDFFDVSILVEVFDLRHLTDIMSGLRTKPLVSEVVRDAG